MGPSIGGRILPAALAPLALNTRTCTWQMSLAAFSPLNTPVVGSGEHTVLDENFGAATVSRVGLTTFISVALTPPNVTLVAPVNPDPSSVIVPGADRRAPYGLMPVTLG